MIFFDKWGLTTVEFGVVVFILGNIYTFIFNLSTKLAFHIIMVKVYQMHCLILIQLFGIVVQVDMNLKR